MPATQKAQTTDSELDSSGRESDAKSSLEPGLTQAHSKARYPVFLTGGAYTRHQRHRGEDLQQDPSMENLKARSIQCDPRAPALINECYCDLTI